MKFDFPIIAIEIKQIFFSPVPWIENLMANRYTLATVLNSRVRSAAEFLRMYKNGDDHQNEQKAGFPVLFPAVAKNANNSRPSSLDPSDRKFVCFSPSSIRLFAESAGYASVDEPTLRMLSEDVTYRLRDLVYSAANLMRNCNQNELITENINQAMKWSDCKPVYGHQIGRRRLEQVYVKDAKVFTTIDREIQLNVLVNDIIYGRRKLDLKERHLNPLGSWINLKSANPVLPQTSSSAQIPEHLINYYNFLIANVYSDDFDLYKHVLNDLATNSNVIELLPFILSFIELGINDVNPTEHNLFRLLMLTNAVIRNQHFYTEICRNLVCLLDSLIICIVEPIGQGNRKEIHWTLREYAATTLAWVLRNWSSVLVNNDILINLLNYVSNLLLDKSRPLDAHYGIILLLRNLGNGYISSFLLPVLQEYMNGLDTLLSEQEFSSSETHSGVIKMNRTLLDIILVLLRSLKANNLNSFASTYASFADLFDDALAARLPVQFDHVEYCNPPPSNEESIYLNAERRSGEELLQAFYPPGNSTNVFPEATLLSSFNDSDSNKFGSEPRDTIGGIRLTGTKLKPGCSLLSGPLLKGRSPKPKRLKTDPTNGEESADADDPGPPAMFEKTPFRPNKKFKIKISGQSIPNDTQLTSNSTAHDQFERFLRACTRLPNVNTRHDSSSIRAQWANRIFSGDVNCVL